VRCGGEAFRMQCLQFHQQKNFMCNEYLSDVVHVCELKETMPGPSFGNGDKNLIFAVMYLSQTCRPWLRAV